MVEEKVKARIKKFDSTKFDYLWIKIEDYEEVPSFFVGKETKQQRRFLLEYIRLAGS